MKSNFDLVNCDQNYNRLDHDSFYIKPHTLKTTNLNVNFIKLYIKVLSISIPNRQNNVTKMWFVEINQP